MSGGTYLLRPTPAALWMSGRGDEEGTSPDRAFNCPSASIRNRRWCPKVHPASSSNGGVGWIGGPWLSHWASEQSPTQRPRQHHASRAGVRWVLPFQWMGSTPLTVEVMARMFMPRPNALAIHD
jgi:hypothetical protein